MRFIGVALGCSLAAIGVARADVAAPGEVLFGDAVVDVAGAKVARKTAQRARCDYEQTAWERARRAWQAQSPTSYFVDATPRRLLAGDWPRESGGRFVLRELGARGERILEADGLTSIVEDGRGALLGFLAADTAGHELRFVEPEGRVRWRLPRKNFYGGATAAVVDGDRLIVATFHRSATGSQLFAVDLASGALRWEADVQQLGVAHSEYYNDVTVEKQGASILLRGTEAGGCYLQIFDRASGKRRLALMDQPWGNWERSQ